METVTLTQNQALGAGAVVGGVFATVWIFAIALWVLLIVAWWKLFTKAGEAGWKSIIPIYNIYVFCKIIGINFWIYCLAIPVVLGILLGVTAGSAVNTISTNPNASFGAVSGLGLVSLILVYGYAIFFDIYTAIKLGNAFKKGSGFKVGLVLLPNIFLLILAFGASKYVGKKAVEAKKD